MLAEKTKMARSSPWDSTWVTIPMALVKTPGKECREQSLLTWHSDEDPQPWSAALVLCRALQSRKRCGTLGSGTRAERSRGTLHVATAQAKARGTRQLWRLQDGHEKRRPQYPRAAAWERPRHCCYGVQKKHHDDDYAPLSCAAPSNSAPLPLAPGIDASQRLPR